MFSDDGHIVDNDADLDGFERSWDGESIFHNFTHKINDASTTDDGISDINAYHQDLELESGEGCERHKLLRGNTLELVTQQLIEPGNFIP